MPEEITFVLLSPQPLAIPRVWGVESTLPKIHELELKDELVAMEESAYCLPEEKCLNVERQI